MQGPGTRIRLSPRLQAVVDLIPPCQTLIDVGTDHAKVALAGILTGRCQRALAIDIKAGPLDRARSAIRQAGLEARVDTRLADGFFDSPPGPDDVVVVAGLGGRETIRLFDQPLPVGASAVLQPQKDLAAVRQQLSRWGWRIHAECLALEKRHLYPVLLLRQDGQVRTLTDLEALLGPILLHERPPGFESHCRQLLTGLRKRVRSHPELASLIRAVNALLEEETHV